MTHAASNDDDFGPEHVRLVKEANPAWLWLAVLGAALMAGRTFPEAAGAAQDHTDSQ